MISIIVPVYNAEKYLERCINSILKQTYSDFELILVDDGSTDNSPKILDEFAEKDDRIKVFHKENGGASTARNLGIKVSKGEYIGFVDADDVIGSQCYEALIYYIITDKSDIVTFSTSSTINDGDDWLRAGENRKVVTSETMLNNFHNEYYKSFGDVYMTKLFKRKIFDKYKFREGIIYEDADLLPFSVEAAETITLLPFSLYYYTLSENSVMRSSFSAKRYMVLEVWKDYIEFFENKKIYDQRDAYAIVYLYEFMRLYLLTKRQHMDFYNDFKPYITEFLKMKKHLRKTKLSRLQRVLMEIMPWSPYLAALIYKKLVA